jgi:hypothetical protein
MTSCCKVYMEMIIVSREKYTIYTRMCVCVYVYIMCLKNAIFCVKADGTYSSNFALYLVCSADTHIDYAKVHRRSVSFVSRTEVRVTTIYGPT